MEYLKLMSDYGCPPLWHYKSNSVGFIDITTLALSNELEEQLWDYAKEFDDGLNWADPGATPDPTEEESQAFDQKGIALWLRLRKELDGRYIVVYHSFHYDKIFEDPQELKQFTTK